MHDADKVIEGLESLYKAMNDNQCYACSHEFIDHVEKFGTEILADAIELINKLKEENDNYALAFIVMSKWSHFDKED